MNSALKARLKQSKKGTKLANSLSLKTRKYRKHSYHTRPKAFVETYGNNIT